MGFDSQNEIIVSMGLKNVESVQLRFTETSKYTIKRIHIETAQSVIMPIKP